VIKSGSLVKLHYKGTLADGTVFDTSEGKEPLSFKVGEKQVIPGFEKGIIGMEIGEKKTIQVSKEEGYEYHSELVQTVPRSAAPKELKLESGMSLALRAPNGQVIPAKVIALSEEMITLDLNSPLAGKDLTFEVEIISVE
jgi:peptidylprolyl isomerase